MREDRTREMDIGREDVYKGEGERRGTGRQWQGRCENHARTKTLITVQRLVKERGPQG